MFANYEPVSQNFPKPNVPILLRDLAVALVDITRKWTGRRREWGEIYSQLEIFFADRLPQ